MTYHCMIISREISKRWAVGYLIFFLGKEDTSKISQTAFARGFWKWLSGVETHVSYRLSVRSYTLSETPFCQASWL